MSGKKSTLVMLERREVEKEQPARTETKEEVSLEEIFRLIGYPESWAESTRGSLAAKGKRFVREKVDSGWETAV